MALEVLGSSGTFKATGRVASPKFLDSSATGGISTGTSEDSN
jgi:hypothetical protein